VISEDLQAKYAVQVLNYWYRIPMGLVLFILLSLCRAAVFDFRACLLELLELPLDIDLSAVHTSLATRDSAVAGDSGEVGKKLVDKVCATRIPTLNHSVSLLHVITDLFAHYMYVFLKFVFVPM
jgi:hypothetical protein